MSYTIEQLATVAGSRHGVDCPKAKHLGAGYLHGPDDDRPYDVDGVLYCGRCHGWIGSTCGTAPERKQAAGQAEAAPLPCTYPICRCKGLPDCERPPAKSFGTKKALGVVP